uniref:Uncharacterized protein n=1 Tax=viral metagenome TaxID=1070528 RepID=A0A6C0AW96_9ZZZZ
MKTCKIHKRYDKETALSPCRFVCKICKLKNIHGFTNPNHVSNPFGYLYLAPMVCTKCANESNLCMWCNISEN